MAQAAIFAVRNLQDELSRHVRVNQATHCTSSLKEWSMFIARNDELLATRHTRVLLDRTLHVDFRKQKLE